MSDNGREALAERLEAIDAFDGDENVNLPNIADALLANGSAFVDAGELERLRTLSDAASRGPYAFNGHAFTLAGADAAFAIAAANFVRTALSEPSPVPAEGARDAERLIETIAREYAAIRAETPEPPS